MQDNDCKQCILEKKARHTEDGGTMAYRRIWEGKLITFPYPLSAFPSIHSLVTGVLLRTLIHIVVSNKDFSSV